MRGLRFTHVCVVAGAVLMAPAPLWAQTPDAQALRQEIEQLRKELDTLQQQYGDRLNALEAKLNATEPTAQQPAPGTAPQAPQQPGAATAQVPPGAEGAGGPTGALPVYGGSAGSKVFNPDIAVIGDFLGAAGSNSVNPAPALAMHESEASFQAIVDPYARADFFLSFGEEGVELEEGFVTFPAIPGGLLVRVGKMRAAFGKVNSLHNHVLPWTDRPIVTNNLVGGEEGIDDAGISVARLIPNRWIFLEATGQVFRGDSGDLFHSSERSDLSLRRPSARVSRHHGKHECRSRDVVLLWAQRIGRLRRRGSRPVHDSALRLRRHRAVAATAAIHLSILRRPLGADLEPSRAARHTTECVRLFRVR